MAISAIVLFPVLFLMEMNGVSGLVQAVTLGLMFGVVGWVEQVRSTRHLVLTDRRLLALGSTWMVRPAGIDWTSPRSELEVVGVRDAAFGMRSIVVRGPDAVDHELRFARSWRTEATKFEENLAAPAVPPPPPPAPSGS